MSFVFPFLTFFQPGILWPELADYRPMQVIAIAAIISSLGRKSEYPRTDTLRHPSIIWMTVFFLVQAISVYRTGVGLVLQELLFWSTYAIFVVVSLLTISDEIALRRYVWGMICGSIWIVVYGIYAVYEGLNTANGGRAGAYGMYENHNDYTFIIIQILPFVFLYMRQERHFMRRLFLAASVLMCVVGVMLSLSRGGMLALVLEAALIISFTMNRRSRLVLLPLVIALGSLAVVYQYAKRAENQGEGYTAEDAESSRVELWKAALEMVKDRPLLGVGSRSFGEFAPIYAEISHDNLSKNAHNTFIDIAATSGLIGLTAFAMMLWMTVRDLRQSVTATKSASARTWVDTTQVATLIALLTLCFRSLFDVKSWDWSFYILVAIATASWGSKSSGHLRTSVLAVSAGDRVSDIGSNTH